MNKILALSLAMLCMANAAMDYTDLDDTFDGDCQGNPTGAFQSPILIESNICGSYDSFTIEFSSIISQFQDPQSEYGAPRIVNDEQKFSHNGIEYTSDFILFRKKAEHILYNEDNRADFEMQIYFTEDNGDSKAVMSFLLYPTGTDNAKQRARIEAKIAAFTSTTATLNLELMNDIIADKIANDIYLNFFTYDGTATYGDCEAVTWYIYASPFYITSAEAADLSDAIEAYEAALDDVFFDEDGNNARSYESEQTVSRICYTGYFTNRMPENYGLWFCIGSIFGYFFISFALENSKAPGDYKENVWTHHAFYSIYKYGNDIFTKRSRLSLVLVTFIHHCMWNSIFYNQADDRTEGSNIIAFAIYSMLITWVVIYLYGCVLRSYYKSKKIYEEEKLKYIQAQAQKKGEAEEEPSDNRSQSQIFLFYFMVWLTVWVGNGICIYSMMELNAWDDQKASNYWVASVFISFFLDQLFFDVIACWLASKSEFVRNCIKNKGYMYDDLCHQTYLLLKQTS